MTVILTIGPLPLGVIETVDEVLVEIERAARETRRFSHGGGKNSQWAFFTGQDGSMMALDPEKFVAVSSGSGVTA